MHSAAFLFSLILVSTTYAYADPFLENYPQPGIGTTGTTRTPPSTVSSDPYARPETVDTPDTPDTSPSPETTPVSQDTLNFRAALDEGDPGRAFAIAQELQRAAPQSPVPYRMGALAAAQQGDRETALAQIQEGLKAAPDDPDLLDLQKLLTPKVEESDPAALKSRTEALLAGLTGLQGLSGPGASGAQAPAAALPASAGPFIPRVGATPGPAGPTAQAAAARNPAIRDGMTKMRMHDFRAAEARFSQRIGEKPGDGAAWRLRAMARRQLGDADAAYKDASEALRLNPKDGWAWKTRALALADLKRYDAALADAARALALDPRDADAYAARARIWRAMGRGEERLADLKRAAELDAEFEAVYRQALGERSVSASTAPRGRALRTSLLMGVALMGLGLMGYILFRRPAPPPSDGGAPPALRDFELMGALGQGGMGEVYEAMDRLLERKVAVKRMRPEIAGDPRERRRFLKEARTVAALKHPHIVEIYSVIERAHELFLVFELVKGETLSGLLARRGRLPLPETAALAAQMAAALDYAHSKSVIHQDLKPSNVMVADGAAKVMDFGIARRAAETLSTAGQGEVIGTPAYMAPEQEQGSPCPASDVFALGACVYEMAVGRRPFTGAGAGLLMAKLQEDFPTPSRLAPELTEAFDRLMRRVLHPDPSRRIPAAGELAEELRRLT